MALATTPSWRPPRLEGPVGVLNALMHRRAPLPLLGDLGLSLVPPPEPRGTAFALRVGADAGLFHLPDAWTAVLLGRLDPAAPAAGPEAAALLLGLALEAELAVSEERLGHAVDLEPAEEPLSEEGLLVGLWLEGTNAPPARLALPAPLAKLLAEMLARRPARPVRHPPDLVFPVALRLAATDLRLGALRRLRPGAVVLPTVRAGEGAALAVLAERHCWPLRAGAGGGLAVSGPRRRAAALGLEDWTMQHGTATGDAEAMSPDELPVRLTFELGRLELPLGELAAIGPGHVFPLPGGADPAVVDILANGRRVGRGEVVGIGEQLGIRVLSLFEQGG